MVTFYSIIVTAFAIVGVIATALKIIDTADERAIRRRMNASTRHRLPRATLRRLRANRLALQASIVNRRAS